MILLVGCGFFIFSNRAEKNENLLEVLQCQLKQEQ
jgi:hypothetical protein